MCDVKNRQASVGSLNGFRSSFFFALAFLHHEISDWDSIPFSLTSLILVYLTHFRIFKLRLWLNLFRLSISKLFYWRQKNRRHTDVEIISMDCREFFVYIRSFGILFASVFCFICFTLAQILRPSSSFDMKKKVFRLFVSFTNINFASNPASFMWAFSSFPGYLFPWKPASFSLFSVHSSVLLPIWFCQFRKTCKNFCQLRSFQPANPDDDDAKRDDDEHKILRLNLS